MSKRDAPATQRNREPILEVLARWLPGPACVLEIASGTGQHAVFFAERLPEIEWQPSDADSASLESIDAWRATCPSARVEEAIQLDASLPSWSIEPVSRPYDAIFSANMIHIAPWSAAEGLMAGASRVLRAGGRLFLYGPFKVDGRHTADSNAAFDTSLRERNPDWGIRDLEVVVEEAKRSGLSCIESNQMPANNMLIVLERDR